MSPTAFSAVVPTSSKSSVVPRALVVAFISSAGFSFAANGATMNPTGTLGLESDSTTAPSSESQNHDQESSFLR
ncbi:hypothetical protein BDV98DRAFT_593499 [Pterulicium gracile]|uniref:Uncharacterized protein n=1 Tax=Pterulicium gracile TaxID=1884261 RepID=A0A5C3QHW1_9AGAR|nr:hypothetical protein BDV98DRAFT_593499 [Pterula gracilis]